MTIYSLYQYTNRENGKKYIGVTCDPVQRHRQHAKGNSNALAFNSAVKKYGIDAFDLKVLALFDRADAACYHEQAAIQKFDTLSPKGYNLIGGAPYTKYRGPMAPESCAKISAARMGIQFSEETKAKMSIASTGRPVSAERRAKFIARMQGNKYAIGNTNRRGQHLSDETKKKLSQSKKGRPSTFLGHHHSDEAKAKMSAAHIGKPPSNKGKHPSLATLQKMSLAHIGVANPKNSVALKKFWATKQALPTKGGIRK